MTLIHASEYSGLICIIFIGAGSSELYPFYLVCLHGEGDLTSPFPVFRWKCGGLILMKLVVPNCKEQFQNDGHRSFEHEAYVMLVAYICWLFL